MMALMPMIKKVRFMYKITIEELKEIQKVLKKIIVINGESVDKMTTKLLHAKMKAKKLSSKIDENYLKIKH